MVKLPVAQADNRLGLTCLSFDWAQLTHKLDFTGVHVIWVRLGSLGSDELQLAICIWHPSDLADVLQLSCLVVSLVNCMSQDSSDVYSI